MRQACFEFIFACWRALGLGSTKRNTSLLFFTGSSGVLGDLPLMQSLLALPQKYRPIIDHSSRSAIGSSKKSAETDRHLAVRRYANRPERDVYVSLIAKGYLQTPTNSKSGTSGRHVPPRQDLETKLLSSEICSSNANLWRPHFNFRST